MGSCRIQKLASAGKNQAFHGDTFIQVSHNGEVADVVKYEGEKGDLFLHLNCEEEAPAFLIGSGGGSLNNITSLDGSINVSGNGDTRNVAVSSVIINQINNKVNQNELEVSNNNLLSIFTKYSSFGVGSNISQVINSFNNEIPIKSATIIMDETQTLLSGVGTFNNFAVLNKATTKQSDIYTPVYVNETLLLYIKSTNTTNNLSGFVQKSKNLRWNTEVPPNLTINSSDYNNNIIYMFNGSIDNSVNITSGRTTDNRIIYSAKPLTTNSGTLLGLDMLIASIN